MGKLYLVATPIGNLADMTFRAIEVLLSVKLIAAEDTRVTKKLLDHYDIKTPMTSYFEQNELVKKDQLLQTLKKFDVALVSDAGTPGISDPGFKLIREALSKGIEVVPIPGATALVPALIASGLPTDSFTYLGFLPKKNNQIREVLSEFTNSTRTLIVYESPYRLVSTIKNVLEVLGDRQVVVAREVSKKFEQFYRMSAKQAIEFFENAQIPGEVVLVIGGLEVAKVWNKSKVTKALRQEIGLSNSLSAAVKEVVKLSGWKKPQVYDLALTLKRNN